MHATNIYDSNITIADLEKVLQESLSTDSKFGKGYSFKDLGDGKGIVSQVGLLTADWTPANDNLPKTFAVKVSAPAPELPENSENQLTELANKEKCDENTERLVRYHNTEVSVFDKLKEHNVADIRLPKIYGTKKRENTKDSGYIIMEHFSGCASLHMNNNLPEDAVIQLIQTVAAFHAQSKLFSDEEQIAMKGKMFGDTFNIFFQMSLGLKQMIKDFGGPEMAEEAEEMCQVIDEMGQPEYIKFIDNTAENLGLPRILCHGDVWMCNLLWNIKNDNFDLKALIDLQTAQFTCPAADLVRLFTGCCSGHYRQSKWEEFIKLYCDFLNKRYQSPYTNEMVLEAYKRMFPPCAFIVAGSIGAVGKMIVDKQPTEEAKTEAHKNLLEKQHYLLKDIIKYHKRNMEILKLGKSE